jgi:hypothetical protein
MNSIIGISPSSAVISVEIRLSDSLSGWNLSEALTKTQCWGGVESALLQINAVVSSSASTESVGTVELIFGWHADC